MTELSWATAAVRLSLGALLLATVAGCGADAITPRTVASPPGPAPTSVREVDPCTFLDQARLSADGMTRIGTATGETARSCTWTAGTQVTLALVRWDPDALTDFSVAFPDLVGGDVTIGGRKVVLSRSKTRPACAGLFFAGRGTVVEIVVGDTGPATADAACERVRVLGEVVIRDLAGRNLLDPAPSSS